MFQIRLNEGISPWHLKCHSFQNQQQESKPKSKKNNYSIQKSSPLPRNSSSGRSTPQILDLDSASNGFYRLSKRRLSNVGTDLQRLERLHLPRTVGMKKPMEQRKVLEEVEVKQFIMLGQKPIEIYRRKESFRSSFVIKHKLKKEGEKQKENIDKERERDRDKKGR